METREFNSILTAQTGRSVVGFANQTCFPEPNGKTIESILRLRNDEEFQGCGALLLCLVIGHPLRLCADVAHALHGTELYRTKGRLSLTTRWRVSVKRALRLAAAPVE